MRKVMIDFGNILTVILSSLLFFFLSFGIVVDPSMWYLKLPFFFLVGYAVYSSLMLPVYTVITEDSIRSQFLFGFYEEILWEDITDIKRTRQYWKGTPLYYIVIGKTFGKPAFFTAVTFLKTRGVRKLLRERFPGRFHL